MKKKSEKARKAKVWLNQQAALAMTPTLLDEIDSDGDVIAWFEKISKMLDQS